jgi:REP element-mobilizing transposase RayT
MARALRVQFEGAIYHVTSRGIERRPIYRTEQDRCRFLDDLFENVETHHIRLYAYALMSNHNHLLFETPRANLSAFMHQLNSSYTIYFNHRHGRTGHLLGGRYKAKLVEGDEYLLNLTRYIHLNPVKIRGLAGVPLPEKRKRLRRYRWSSYRSYAGLSRRQDGVDYGPLTELVAQGRSNQARAYRGYVESGLAEEDRELMEAMGRSSKAIGLEPFCRWAEEAYQDLVAEQGQPTDVTMRRVESAPTAEEILNAVTDETAVTLAEMRVWGCTSDARLLAMRLLNELGGLTQRQVAERLGFRDGSTVSRRLAEIGKRMKDDRSFRQTYDRIRRSVG